MSGIMGGNLVVFLLLFAPPIAKTAVPGTFFWKPRLGLDLAIPTTEPTVKVHQPSRSTIAEGLVVMIDGYQAGMTMVAIAAGLSSITAYPYLNPGSAYFYTTAYRWMLRYFSLYPRWLSGAGGNFVDTLKVWKRRYYYMDEFVPSWMQKALFYVDKESWQKEHLDWRRFKKYSEGAFGKHYRYPTKIFNDFKSELTVETIEILEVSSDSS